MLIAISSIVWGKNRQYEFSDYVTICSCRTLRHHLFLSNYASPFVLVELCVTICSWRTLRHHLFLSNSASPFVFVELCVTICSCRTMRHHLFLSNSASPFVLDALCVTICSCRTLRHHLVLSNSASPFVLVELCVTICSWRTLRHHLFLSNSASPLNFVLDEVCVTICSCRTHDLPLRSVFLFCFVFKWHNWVWAQRVTKSVDLTTVSIQKPIDLALLRLPLGVIRKQVIEGHIDWPFLKRV